eukprot:jgi/Botrbrau1/21971/Bobra.0249s0093.1
MAYIQFNAENCLFEGNDENTKNPLKDSISALSQSALKEILSSSNCHMSEFDKFSILESWLKSKAEIAHAGMEQSVHPMTMPIDLFQTLNLAAMSPSDLQHLVGHPLISNSRDHLVTILNVVSSRPCPLEAAGRALKLHKDKLDGKTEPFWIQPVFGHSWNTTEKHLKGEKKWADRTLEWLEDFKRQLSSVPNPSSTLHQPSS